MHALVNFPVYKASPNGPPRDFGPELSESHYLEFWDFVDSAGISVKSPYATRETSQFTTVSCLPNQPQLQQALQILEHRGWLPISGSVPPSLRRSHFTLRIARQWDAADLDAASLLRFCGWGSIKGNFAGFVAYRNEACVAAVVLSPEIQNSWDEPFGSIDGKHDFVAHNRIKAFLEGRLKHLHFEPLKWNRPEAMQADFWCLSSDIVMPPCQTPIILTDGELWYEEGGFSPPQLAFERAAVDAMGEFDAAWTQEITGETAENRPNFRGRTLIVSQRFREVTRELITREDQYIAFEPVRLT